MDIKDISRENASFWDELCGSQLAKSLGIVDSSPASLNKFDDWYLSYYSYLYNHIPFQELHGKDVLEIGLGYGTVSQKIAASGSNYRGLDIAAGPVEMVNFRLRQANLPGSAVQGSILEPQFNPESFDVIIAIGCFHHTGNIKLAIDQSYRLLRTGGKLIFMVYYAYSYRRFYTTPRITFQYMFKELLGFRNVVGNSESIERAAYDTNSEGKAAPHTDWISIRSLKKMCDNYSSFRAQLENIDQEKPFSRIPRTKLLMTCIPRIAGLDLYATAVK